MLTMAAVVALSASAAPEKEPVSNGQYYKLFAPLTFYHAVAGDQLSIASDDPDEVSQAINQALMHVYLNRPDLVEVTETEAAVVSVTENVPASPTVQPAAPVSPAAPVAVSASGPVAGTKVLSPMPGTVLSVKVKPGDAVAAGDVLMILEAMKMENEIVAPVAGTVKQIPVAKGQSVDTDTLLAVL